MTDNIKVNIIAKHVIKSTTNTGDLAKQYFELLQSKGKNSALFIRKLVLVNTDFKMWNKHGCLLKEYKGFRLYERCFSIQLKTFSDVNEWLRNLTFNQTIDKK